MMQQRDWVEEAMTIIDDESNQSEEAQRLRAVQEFYQRGVLRQGGIGEEPV